MNAPAPRHFPEPTKHPAIVLCRFPVPEGAKLKDRPGIILAWHDPVNPKDPSVVTVCYGTHVIKDRVYAHDLIIEPAHGPAFVQAGIYEPTRFDLAQIEQLPYTDKVFIVPKYPNYGNTPQLGFIAPELMAELKAAVAAGQRERQRRERAAKR